MLVTQGTVAPRQGQVTVGGDEPPDHGKEQPAARKDMVKMSSVYGHLRSTSVVNTSCRNGLAPRMFLWATLQLRSWTAKRAFRSHRDAVPGLYGVLHVA